jgi:hypothetical protein
VLEPREGRRTALALAGHLPRPGIVVRLPSHAIAPFDRLLRLKLTIEHYSEPPTFQPDMQNDGRAGQSELVACASTTSSVAALAGEGGAEA